MKTMPTFLDCFLDFMDCWSEGIAMPLGAMLMALMIGWELDPSIVLDEVGHGNSSKGFAKFYSLCVKFIVPVVMAFVLAGSLKGNCGGSATMWYIFAGIVLVGFWIFAAVGKKKAEE